MRVLLVGAGASYSIKDVENGYLRALQQAGVDTKVYLLDRRIDIAQRWLRMLWRERGKRPEDAPTFPDIIYRASIEALEMALRFQVDWVLVISGMFFHPDVLVMLRRAGIRTAMLFTESPYDDEAQARVAPLVDVCWTTERSSVRHFPNGGYLRHAYDPETHRPLGAIAEGTPAHDVVFVGTGFQERIELLEAVKWNGIDLGLYGTWSLLPPRHRLRQFVRGRELKNEDAINLYRNAKIGLNLHRRSKGWGKQAPRIERAESLNPRAYELAACGVFQISDRRAEVAETFGYSVPTFPDAVGLELLVRDYLEHDRERQACALSARRQILPHTFAERVNTILADLEAFEGSTMTHGRQVRGA